MSGVTIRTVNALIDKQSLPLRGKKINFNIVEIENWIKDTEKYLDKKDKFSYRKDEIKKLWTRIKNYKQI